MVFVCLLQLLEVQSHSTLAHPKIMENMKDIKNTDYKIRVVVVGYIVHYDSLSFLDTWMPFCVRKYYHVFVSFNLLCLKTLVPYDITFSSEIRQYIP